jgi:hypothetical protein
MENTDTLLLTLLATYKKFPTGLATTRGMAKNIPPLPPVPPVPPVEKGEPGSSVKAPPAPTENPETVFALLTLSLV